MFDDIRTALTRDPALLARDFAAAGALTALLVAALMVPGLI